MREFLLPGASHTVFDGTDLDSFAKGAHHVGANKVGEKFLTPTLAKSSQLEGGCTRALGLFKWPVMAPICTSSVMWVE